MDLFEYAARLKLRFVSVKGELNAEQLWDVPLRSRDDFNLDCIARGISRNLKTASEESFVEVAKNPAQDRLALALDIVKYVIGDKLASEVATKRLADNKIEREKLLKILAEKQDGKLSELSEKELKKRIEALD